MKDHRGIMNLSDFTTKHKWTWSIIVFVVGLLLGGIIGGVFGLPIQNYLYPNPPKYAVTISCDEAEILANQINNSNQSITAKVIQTNNSSLCYLQYQVALHDNLGISECLNVIVKNENGTVISQYNGCSSTTTTTSTP
jgi:hypothetical protein